MTNPIVERVARALFETNVIASGRFPTWEGVPEAVKAEWYRYSRAAIYALREPSEAMIQAGHGPFEVGTDPNLISQRLRVAMFTLMIDAALAEDET